MSVGCNSDDKAMAKKTAAVQVVHYLVTTGIYGHAATD